MHSSLFTLLVVALLATQTLADSVDKTLFAYVASDRLVTQTLAHDTTTTPRADVASDHILVTQLEKMETQLSAMQPLLCRIQGGEWVATSSSASTSTSSSPLIQSLATCVGRGDTSLPFNNGRFAHINGDARALMHRVHLHLAGEFCFASLEAFNFYTSPCNISCTTIHNITINTSAIRVAGARHARRHRHGRAARRTGTVMRVLSSACIQVFSTVAAWHIDRETVRKECKRTTNQNHNVAPTDGGGSISESDDSDGSAHRVNHFDPLHINQLHSTPHKSHVIAILHTIKEIGAHSSYDDNDLNGNNPHASMEKRLGANDDWFSQLRVQTRGFGRSMMQILDTLGIDDVHGSAAAMTVGLSSNGSGSGGDHQIAAAAEAAEAAKLRQLLLGDDECYALCQVQALLERAVRLVRRTRAALCTIANDTPSCAQSAGSTSLEVTAELLWQEAVGGASALVTLYLCSFQSALVNLTDQNGTLHTHYRCLCRKLTSGP
jgi:hypothetical protein